MLSFAAAFMTLLDRAGSTPFGRPHQILLLGFLFLGRRPGGYLPQSFSGGGKTQRSVVMSFSGSEEASGDQQPMQILQLLFDIVWIGDRAGDFSSQRVSVSLAQPGNPGAESGNRHADAFCHLFLIR
jgi:hypothetical protein